MRLDKKQLMLQHVFSGVQDFITRDYHSCEKPFAVPESELGVLQV